MNVDSISPKSFLVDEDCAKVENPGFVDEEEEKSKQEYTAEDKVIRQNKYEVSTSEPEWTQRVLNDVKLLWNISVHVDIPAFEDYERMCLFTNHWSTTMEDLELLRRNLTRAVKHSETGFLTFGGHWNPKQKTCDKEDCFFGEGHKYEL